MERKGRDSLLLPLRRPDILVMGTGRSGTSFTTYVLMQEFKVCMGSDIKTKKSRKCPLGPLEDKKMLQATVNITKGRFNLDKRADLPVKPWLEAFAKVHTECTADLVGTKNVHLAWLTPRQLQEINPRLVIRTWRNKDDTVHSLKRWSKHNGFSWARYYDRREQSMRELEEYTDVPFVWVYYPTKHQQLSVDGVKEILYPYIEELKREH